MNYIEHIRHPKRLLLVWQGAEGSARLRRSVAELVCEGTVVRFRYLVGTNDFDEACNAGFVSFPAFRKLDAEYSLGVVDTLLRRLPPKSRGDYGKYLEQFRIRIDQPVSAFELLGITGAKLPSDGFSIVDPLEEMTTDCDVMMEVAGFRHVAKESGISVSDIRQGSDVRFVPEPDNEHDPNAVLVMFNQAPIGYVIRQQAPAIKQLLSTSEVRAKVERINGTEDRPLIHLLTNIRVGQMLMAN